MNNFLWQSILKSTFFDGKGRGVFRVLETGGYFFCGGFRVCKKIGFGIIAINFSFFIRKNFSLRKGNNAHGLLFSLAKIIKMTIKNSEEPEAESSPTRSGSEESSRNDFFRGSGFFSLWDF